VVTYQLKAGASPHHRPPLKGLSDNADTPA